MRLAVFSDVHSNHHALKACLKEAEKQKADGYIFLGDYISDCANPHETMKLIYRAKQEMPCWFVRGNREEYNRPAEPPQLRQRLGKRHYNRLPSIHLRGANGGGSRVHLRIAVYADN